MATMKEILHCLLCQQIISLSSLTLLQTGLKVAEPVLALCEYMSFAKSWLEKGCSSQAETNILMKDFD